MLTMRDFISDSGLHKALDVVESWVGYTIPATPMPLQIQEVSRCRMHLNEDTGLFELLFIKEEPQSQAVYCHELSHLIVWINGAVIKYDFMPPIPGVFFFPPVRFFNEQIWSYMQHIPVFKLVEELGYDEIFDYTPVVESLISCIQQNLLFPDMDARSFAPGKEQVLCQAGEIVKHLSFPVAGETRDALRKAAREIIPQSLKLADTILSTLGPRTLLGPQEYQEYLSEIHRIAGLPRANLQFSFLNKTSLDFRSNIIKATQI